METNTSEQPVSTSPPLPTNSSGHDLPSIKQLLNESWDGFTKSMLNLFIVNVIGLVAYLLLFILIIIVFATVGVGVLSVVNMKSVESVASTLLAPSVITAAIIGGLVFLVASIIISFVMQIGSVIAVSDYKQRPSVGSIIRRSFSFIIPLLVVSILIGIINLGAFFVFILPAILFYFFFMFSPFEVILGNQKGISALKRSMAMVVHNFGGVLIRVLVLIGVYIAVVVFIPNILLKIEPATGTIVNIFTFFLSFLISWFMLSYMITLYKHAKATVGEEEKSSIKWVWVVSIIGWIIALMVFFSTYKMISSGVFNSLFESALKNKMSTEGSKPDIYNFNTGQGITTSPSPSPFPVIQQKSVSSCIQYNIREGEFASNKCYLQKDYDDLIYYLNRFSSAVFSYNGAVSSMEITCSGSDFFKNSCEKDKATKEKAGQDMNAYRATINRIIATGK